MDKDTLVEIIKKRLFENTSIGSSCKLVAEAAVSKGCYSAHAVWRRIIFDFAGTLMSLESLHTRLHLHSIKANGADKRIFFLRI